MAYEHQEYPKWVRGVVAHDEADEARINAEKDGEEAAKQEEPQQEPKHEEPQQEPKHEQE